MYCVIQKIENKKPNKYGGNKKLEVGTFTWHIDDGKPATKYTYNFTGKFERTIKTAYRISIHKSYRENGKVKKKQWVLCTMSYYDLVEWDLYNCADSKITKVSEEIGVSVDDIYNMVCEKLNPIIETVTKEYEGTEEYKTKVKHNKIIAKYTEAKTKFENKYGEDTYDYCYDVFGTLRNEEYLNQLKAGWDKKQQYESSYYDNFKNNYSNYDFSGYFSSKNSNYTDDEKSKLKKIYKVLAMKFHPDLNNGDSEMMKLVNKLKEEWGI
ncbi:MULTISPECIES: J domain-containing protein [Clostridium]|uniref:J domain-containing protein n=1 Tax=Clostridium TaxID=1485 RepID=UPI0008256038|nr:MULTISPECIES: J domain-containing protein [Clostridium]PJI08315.1 J domain-containing protein [Clostridium sp. CT7]